MTTAAAATAAAWNDAGEASSGLGATAAAILCGVVIVVGVLLNALVLFIFYAEKLLHASSSNVHVFSQRCVIEQPLAKLFEII